MIEFFQTLGKGVMQGFNQFINNDLQNFMPLFVIAAVALAVFLIKEIILKIKAKKDYYGE
jgi:hypothetical protein